MNLENQPKRRAWGWVSSGMSLSAAAVVVYVFAHPRCFTAAGSDYVTHYLLGAWCLAELAALLAGVLGMIGVILTRGRAWSPWSGIALGVLVFVAGIVYPVVCFTSGVARELSKPGFHGLGK